MANTPEYRYKSGKLGEDGYVSHTAFGYSCTNSRAQEIFQGCASNGGYIDIIGRGIGRQGSVDQAYDEIAKELGVRVVRMRESGIAGSRDESNGLIRFVTSDLNALTKALNDKKMLGDEELAFIQEQEQVPDLAERKAKWVAQLSPTSANLNEISPGTRITRKFDVELGKYIVEHAAEVGEALRGREAPELAKRAAEAASITERLAGQARRPRPMIEVVLADDPAREQQAAQRRLDCTRLVACASALCPEVLEKAYEGMSHEEIAEKLAGGAKKDSARGGTLATAELNLKIQEVTGKAPATGGRDDF